MEFFLTRNKFSASQFTLISNHVSVFSLIVLIESSPSLINIASYFWFFNRFCNVSKIRRAKLRIEKSEGGEGGEGDDGGGEGEGVIPRKRRRTGEKGQRSKHVLPVQCIICKKEKWTKQSFGPRKKEPLTNCEYEKGIANIYYMTPLFTVILMERHLNMIV